MTPAAGGMAPPSPGEQTVKIVVEHQATLSKKKQNAIKEENGKLRAQVANRERSVQHYRDLVDRHRETLHKQSKYIKQLKGVLRECVDEFGHDEANADLFKRIEKLLG